MRLWTTLLLVVVLSLPLAACGSSMPADDGQSGATGLASPSFPATSVPATAVSKTQQYFETHCRGDYTMTLRYTADVGGGMAEVINTVAVAGDKLYSDIKSDTMHMATLQLDGKAYSLLHDQKTYMELAPGNGTDKMINPAAYIGSAESLPDGGYQTGETEINGESCHFEEFTVPDGKITYCFSGGSLRYIIPSYGSTRTEMEVIEVSDSVLATHFTIPEGYTKLVV